METIVHVAGDSPVAPEQSTSLEMTANGSLVAEAGHLIGAACLEHCPIIGVMPEDSVAGILQSCVDDGQRLYCSRPKAGQSPDRYVCRQPDELTKQAMMARAKNKTQQATGAN